MILVTGEVQTVVKQARTSQYVVFNLTPPDAVVELNGELLKTEGGVASKMVKFGTYSYRVQAPDYLLEAGSVTVDDPDNKKIVNVSLKPNFAKVSISVDNNAEIWINGEKKGIGSWTGNLGAGTYELEAKKEGHRSTLMTKDIEVTPDPQIVSLQAPIPIFGEADINSSPGMADIFLDGKNVGKTPQLISKLLIGDHQIRFVREGYEDYVSTITISENETFNIHAQLKERAASFVENSKTNTLYYEGNIGNNVWRVGIVDTEDIIKMMPEYSKAQKDIDALQAQYEADLKSMQDELQKKAEAFDKEQATLPDNIKQRRQTELQEMYTKIQQTYQDNQQALQKAAQEKMQAITAKVLDAIRIVGDRGKFIRISETNAGTPYLNKSYLIDVTSLVKKEMKLISIASVDLDKKNVLNGKLGYINTQEIIQAMPEYNKVKKEVDALQNQYDSELKSMQDELQKKSEVFEKEQVRLPENIKQRRQAELQDMYTKIQQLYQDNQQALQKASQEKMQTLSAKVLDATQTIGDNDGYAIIYDMNAGIPFMNESYMIDVTSFVMKRLKIPTKTDGIPTKKNLLTAKWGHVDTQQIIQAMPEYNRAKTEIDALQQQYEADLKSMQDELQKKAESFDKEQAMLPENVKQSRQSELQDQYTRIQQSYQDNQQALQNASQEKMQAITAKVLDAIKAVGQEGGYIIIDESKSGIPYISPGLSVDVTSLVKLKMGL